MRGETAQTAGSHWGLSWTYDRYGNRFSQSVTKGTAPSQSLTVSTTTNRVSGWSYDAVGNTLNDGLHTYTYDANNQVTQLGSGTAVYKYDGAGSRVMKIKASETIRYVMGVGEYSSVSGWKKLYVHLGSEKLIQYSGGTTYFFHSDHLGTPRVQTDAAGNVVETWNNYPFGEQWTKTGGAGNEHRFTGHLRDTESGNEYAGARYYSNVRGRWLSVDPVIGSLGNPQRLNRFAYVMNDPVTFLDRHGRQPEPGVYIPSWKDLPLDRHGDYSFKPMDLVPDDFESFSRLDPELDHQKWFDCFEKYKRMVPSPSPTSNAGLTLKNNAETSMLLRASKPMGSYVWAWNVTHGWDYNVWDPDYVAGENTSLYDSFTAFNYGFTAAGLGLPVTVAMFGAGAFDWLETEGAGLSDLVQDILSEADLGEKPHDAFQTRNGYKFYSLMMNCMMGNDRSRGRTVGERN